MARREISPPRRFGARSTADARADIEAGLKARPRPNVRRLRDIEESPVVESHLELEERIRTRAYEIYRSHGREGTALDDWLRAEREVLGRGRQPAQDRGTTVGDAHRPSRELTDAAGEA